MIAASLLIVSASALAQDPDPYFEGLVPVPAGRVMLGADQRKIEDWIKEKPELALELGAQTPRTKADVEAFAIGATEVTNEQYFRFVEATGAQPPFSWNDITPEQLRDIIAKGKEEFGPEWVFDGLSASKWWDEHWQNEEYKWSFKPEMALLPVTYVSQEDAIAYCRWTGLRLPTETEWVRAARGDGDHEYPYGDEFDPKLVPHNNTAPRNLAYKLLPVNSLPGNASPMGCVDMCGNVWEWTDSGFGPLPEFETFQVRTGRDRTTVAPSFDASSPVIKGGAFNSPDAATRIDMRTGIFTVARVGFVGYRVASSARRCENALRYAVREIETQVLGEMASEVIDPASSIGLDKRYFADLGPIAAARKDPGGGIPASTPPESYAVFDGYDCFAVAPLRAIEFNSTSKLQRDTLDNGARPVGVLHSTFDLSEPNLPKGTYVLSYLGPLDEKEIVVRGATLPERLREKVTATASTDPIPGPSLASLELEPDTEYMLVVGEDNSALAAMPLKFKSKYTNIRQVDPKVTINLASGHLDYELAVPDNRGRKAFEFTFSMIPNSPKGDLVSVDFWEGNRFEVKEPVSK